MIKKIGRAKKIFIFSSCLIIAGAAVSAWLWTFIPFPGELLNLRSKISLRILDRNGILLREVLSDDSGKGQWVGLDRIPAHMINASVAAEDARFYSHAGIDFLATIRAVMQNASKRRIVSGGSTITQQVMRNIFHFPRDLPHKALEALYAIRLERSLKKEEIVAQYLNLAPYGNQVYGIEAASRLYFQKPAFYLSLAECCFLAAIPKSPVEFNPYSNFKRTKNRQREILSRMYEKGFVDRDSFKRAIKERVNIVPPEKCFRAPHFCEWVLSQLSAEQKQGIKTIVTSLDYYIQKEVEGFTAQQIKTLKDQGVTNGAVTVIDNRTGEIIAMVGSADFFSRFIGGQVNGVLALRQPGSTLKPFTYGLALESGMTPASIIPDIPTFLQTANGKFAPENYDKKYHGPVRMRTALSCSYNVPAVRTADRIGINALLEKLRAGGFKSLNKSAEFYGPGLTLGSGEITLLELANGYRSFALNGVYSEYRSILGMKGLQGEEVQYFSDTGTRVVFSPQIAWVVTDMISDQGARIPAFGEGGPLSFPFPCACKTGTSKDYRDNWTVGFTPRYTIGVWVGNFNGEPMYSVSGVTGAAPLFHEIMIFLERNKPALAFCEPAGIVHGRICPLSGLIPGPNCPYSMDEVFFDGTQPGSTCDFHRTYRIDARNELLAGENCPEEYAEMRLYEVMPPEFKSWAKKEGYTFPPTTLSLLGPDTVAKESCFKGSKYQPENLSIAFPVDESVFKIDPILRREYQAIKFTATVPEKFSQVVWKVDGETIATVGEPYAAWWNLTPGRHKIEAVGIAGRNKPAHSSVRIIVLN